MRSFAAGFLALGVAAFPAAAQEFTTLKGHGGPVMGLDVNDTTGRLATASFDNSVGLWDDRTPRWFEGHEAAVISVRFIDGTFKEEYQW